MKSQEFISGLIFLLIGILLFFFSWELPNGDGTTLGPRYWPQLITFGLIVLATLLTLRGIFSPVVQRANFSWSGSRRKQWLLIPILTATYIILWTFWNFFISTVLFQFSLMFVMYPKRPTRLLFYSLVITFVLYASFYWGMRIPLH